MLRAYARGVRSLPHGEGHRHGDVVHDVHGQPHRRVQHHEHRQEVPRPLGRAQVSTPVTWFHEKKMPYSLINIDTFKNVHKVIDTFKNIYKEF